jgi:hypothetical protein
MNVIQQEDADYIHEGSSSRFYETSDFFEWFCSMVDAYIDISIDDGNETTSIPFVLELWTRKDQENSNQQSLTSVNEKLLNDSDYIKSRLLIVFSHIIDDDSVYIETTRMTRNDKLSFWNVQQDFSFIKRYPFSRKSFYTKNNSQKMNLEKVFYDWTTEILMALVTLLSVVYKESMSNTDRFATLNSNLVNYGDLIISSLSGELPEKSLNINSSNEVMLIDPPVDATSSDIVGGVSPDAGEA